MINPGSERPRGMAMDDSRPAHGVLGIDQRNSTGIGDAIILEMGDEPKSRRFPPGALISSRRCSILSGSNQSFADLPS